MEFSGVNYSTHLKNKVENAAVDISVQHGKGKQCRQCEEKDPV